MNNTINEVLKFVLENDVKFIRLVFCDIFGNMKNVAIMAHQLQKAFEQGIPFDVCSIRGYKKLSNEELFLHPDPTTLAILPWRPQQGRVVRFFCDIKYADGKVFEACGRSVLQKATEKASKMGYSTKIGAECEFYLFELDEKGMPTKIPHDYAGYLDVAPLDRGENVRREICLNLEEMGISVSGSHHESGDGQNEIDFDLVDGLTSADDLITFKTVTRTIAWGNGLFASFMPKPYNDQSGSGLHINISLTKNFKNIFSDELLKSDGESFVAGILNRIKEITVFLNPITNSYNRFGAFEAPKYITWSYQNFSPLIKIIADIAGDEKMELRSADPSCNPYLAYALLIYAGLEGIEKQLKLSNEMDINSIYNLEECKNIYDEIPNNLMQAIQYAKESDFVKSVIHKDLLDAYLTEKYEEYKLYEKQLDKWSFEQDLYFSKI